MKYRKKSIVIEALPWDGTSHSAADIINWILSKGGTARFHERQPFIPDIQPAQPPRIVIDTHDPVGSAWVLPGYFVIASGQGQFDPCKPDIFDATYEKVDPETEADA